METNAKIYEIISEESENDLRSDRKVLGPHCVVERLQSTQIVLQNKLVLRRSQIKKELNYLIAKPLHTHK